MIIYPFPEEINTNKSLTVAAMRIQEVFKVWGYDFPFGFFQELVTRYNESYRNADVIHINPHAIAARVRIYLADGTTPIAVLVEQDKKQHSVVYGDPTHLRIYVLEGEL